MNIVRIIVLVVAGLAALAAAVFVRGAMQAPAPEPARQEAAAPEPAAQMRVLAAARDIGPGERVDASDFRWTPWPEEAVIAAYLTQEADADALERLAGAVARSSFAAGEPVIERKLVQPGQAGFMAAVLTPGMRAVAVPISARSGAGGFILPNDRVDIIATEDNENGAGAVITVENVRVLAIDQTYSEEEDGAVLGSTATLELTQDQARQVARAVAVGDVSLALRSVADTSGGPRLPGGQQDAGASSQNQVVRVIRYGNERRVALQGGAP
jgi:pilus assembly protein CpaB